jgi:hypothetical protein
MSTEKQEKLTAAEITKRMIPTHLESVSADDLRAEVEKGMEGELPAEVAQEDDPRGRNPFTFKFDWTDTRGKKWVGTFTTHYPTPRDLLQAGTMQARLTGSAPKDSLDALTDEIAFIVARLSFCLDTRPDWFADPLSMVDGVPIMQAVYSEVLSFETFFRQHGTVTPSSKAKPGNK